MKCWEKVQHVRRMVLLQQRNVSQAKCIKYTQTDKRRDGPCLGK